MSVVDPDRARTVPLLSLRGVGRTYAQGSNATTSLRSVSLDVFPGDFVAIVGPSGAGKSTLMNILGFLDKPTSGVYYFDGVDSRRLTERQRNRIRNERIGFVFQDSHMLLDDSAAGNASLGLEVRGAPIDIRRRSVGRALIAVGLKHKERDLARSLSGGERQRVAIARAITAAPTMILADEPTGALDSANTKNIIAKLKELNAAGTTVVVITHDGEVAAAAGRTVELVDGVLDAGGFGTALTIEPSADGSGPASAPDQSTPSPQRSRRNHPVRVEALTALSTLASNAGRTALLLFAFALGSGGLVGAVGISQSASNQISERLTAASLDEVTVDLSTFPPPDAPISTPEGNPAAGNLTFPDSTVPLTVAATIAGIPHVQRVGYSGSLAQGTTSIRLLPPATPGVSFTGTTLIADAGYLATQDASVNPKQAATLLSNTWEGAVAIVGHAAAAELGVAEGGPGVEIWVGESPVDVVGIITDEGRDARLATAVVLSPAAAAELAIQDPKLTARTDRGFPASVAEAIPLAVKPSQPDSVRVGTVADLRNLRLGVGDDLSALVAVVSVLLLVLALLMSAVAMYMSVRTRAAQIALRRAVGASRSSIGRLFLFEGAFVGIAGGVTGTALGLCGLLMFCLIRGWEPTLDPSTTLAGVLVGTLAGLVSATYPAAVAARQDPAQAIRGQ